MVSWAEIWNRFVFSSPAGKITADVSGNKSKIGCNDGLRLC